MSRQMHWVIGDIHGMLRPLNALLDQVAKRDTHPRYVFVGDYVNRGPDSRGVIDRLLTLEHATFLRGNHDDIFDLVLNADCYICRPVAPDPLAAFTWFMQHGLSETLTSYGVDVALLDHLLRFPDELRLIRTLVVVPEAHRKFIRSLRPLVEFDTFFVAHAFWDPHEEDHSPDLLTRLSADSKLRFKVLWQRYQERQIQSKKRWKRTGFFGHTPVANYSEDKPNEPLFGPDIVLLDTGAALGPEGRLSAVCAETKEVVQVDRSGALVPSTT